MSLWSWIYLLLWKSNAFSFNFSYLKFEKNVTNLSVQGWESLQFQYWEVDDNSGSLSLHSLVDKFVKMTT